MSKMYRLKQWIKTLLNHRAIIEGLNRENWHTEDNAYKIINLMTAFNVGIQIKPTEKCFGYTVILQRGSTRGAFRCEMKVPPIHKIQYIINMMDEHDKKKARKEKRRAKANLKGQTNNEKK